MKSIIGLFVSILLTFPLGVAAESHDWEGLERRVTRLVEEALTHREGVGFVVGVVRGNESRIWTFGETEAGNGIRPSCSSLFEIGSITKTFTASLLALLVERGQVRLRDPIETLWPQLMGTDAGEITLLELATHTSGLPRLPKFFSRTSSFENPYAEFDRDDLMEDLFQHQKPEVKSHNYSNLGMAVLGQVLSDVLSGQQFFDLLKNEIFAPIGMTQTLESVLGPRPEHLTSGHDGTLDPVSPWTFRAMSPAGSLLSSGSDMMRYLQFLLSPPDSELGRGVQSAMKAQAPIREGSSSAIGLGWYLFERNERKFVQHNGATGGFRSDLMLDLDSKMGAFILSNAALMPDCLMEFALGLPCNPPVRPDLSADQLARWVGTYQSSDLGVRVEVRFERGFMTITADNQPKMRLFPLSEDEFSIREYGVRIRFNPSSESMTRSLVLFQNGQSFQFNEVRN